MSGRNFLDSQTDQKISVSEQKKALRERRFQRNRNNETENRIVNSRKLEIEKQEKSGNGSKVEREKYQREKGEECESGKEKV